MKAMCKYCNWFYSIDCMAHDEHDLCENFEPACELEDEPVSGDAVTRAIEIIKQFCEEMKPEGCNRCFIKSWCYSMENNAPRELEVPEL